MEISICLLLVIVRLSCSLEIESKEASNDGKRSTKITNLPLELLLMIFDDFDLQTLASVSKAHPNTQTAAEMLFRNKHGEEEFKNDHRADYKIFTAFQHVMKKMEFSCEYCDPNFLLDFDRSMNNSELINVHLRKCTDNSFKYLKHAFKKVENVRFYDCTLKTTDLNRIFPAMKKLDIQAIQMHRSVVDPVITVQYFPHMIEFRDEYNPGSDYFNWRLRLNPQLKTLYTNAHEWKQIRAISQILPNLERLDLEFNDLYLSGSSFRGDPIHFPNLKAFRIAGDFKNRVPIVFGNLEDISCRGLVDELFEIILQNKKLRKIAAYDFTDDQFQQIADELPNLEEIFTGYDVSKAGRVDRVAHIMINSDTLRRVHFWGVTHDALNVVAARLPPSWHLTRDLVFRHFIFTRD